MCVWLFVGPSDGLVLLSIFSIFSYLFNSKIWNLTFININYYLIQNIIIFINNNIIINYNLLINNILKNIIFKNNYLNNFLNNNFFEIFFGFNLHLNLLNDYFAIRLIKRTVASPYECIVVVGAVWSGLTIFFQTISGKLLLLLLFLIMNVYYY